VTKVEIGNAVLYHGDCLEILPTLPKVDAVITDPPYLNLDGSYKRNYQGGVGRKVTVSSCVGDRWGASLLWVSKLNVGKAVMAFCSFQSVVEMGEALSEIGSPIALVTWFKRNAPPTGKNVPHHMTEFVWCFRVSPGPAWDRLPSLIDVPNINPGCMATERIVDDELKSVHPTQKPIAVMEKLLIPGVDFVLDPFCGTGTTGVACMNLGRKFIGIEIEKKYFEIAVERIDQAQRQGRMFA